MKKPMHKFVHTLIFIAVVASVAALVMVLWNALIPSIIGWSAINYWQAAGLLVLSKLLLGGFGHHWMYHFGNHWRGDHHKGRGEGFRHMHEAMKDMSRDERREFIRERFRQGFGEDMQSPHPHNKKD